MNDTRKLRYLLGMSAALALGLALRCWFIAHTPRVAGDTLVYGAIATNWMERGVYGFVPADSGIQPTLIRLPGYPLFLAACFHLFGAARYIAVMYVQAGVDLVSCLLAGALARRLCGAGAGMAALWLAALCPFTASYVAAPLTETLTLFTITLAFYALARWRSAGCGFNQWLWVLALALSYSILLRPEQVLLAAAILPAMLWTGRREQPLRAAAPMLAAALCMMLPLVPWTIRNERTFHVFQPLAPRFATDPGEPVPRGFQRWYRTWAIDFTSTEDVYWNYDGGPIHAADLPGRAFDSANQRLRTEALIDDYNETTSQSAEFDTRFAEIAAERIAAHPFRFYVALPLARLANMTLRPRTEMFATPLAWWRFGEHPRATIFAGAYATLNVAYLALALVGWIASRPRWTAHLPVVVAMIATIVLRCALLLTLDNSEPRYTLEFFPVVFVLAAAVFRDRAEPST